MRWTSGSAHASSQAAAPARSAPSGSVAAAAEPRADPRGDLLLDLLEDRREELVLVGELVVERAAGDARGRGRSPRCPTSREAALGEQRPGGGDAAPRGWRPSARPGASLDFHTGCMYVTCSLYVTATHGGRQHAQHDRAAAGHHPLPRRGGDGPPPVVFVHGLLVDATPVGRRRRARSRDGVRCIVPDLPLGSHRDAMHADADLSPRGIAALIADLLEALDLRDVTLVANDTGGAICQLVATEHPERIGRLVLTPLRRVRELPAADVPPAAVRRRRLPGVLLAGRCRPHAHPARAALPIAYGWLAKRPVPRRCSTRWVAPRAAHRRRPARRRQAPGGDRRAGHVDGRRAARRLRQAGALLWPPRGPDLPLSSMPSGSQTSSPTRASRR